MMAETKTNDAETVQRIRRFIHDINGPLTGILGFSQILVSSIPEGEVKTDLETIYTEATRCQQMINDLSVWTKRLISNEQEESEAGWRPWVSLSREARNGGQTKNGAKATPQAASSTNGDMRPENGRGRSAHQANSALVNLCSPAPEGAPNQGTEE